MCLEEALGCVLGPSNRCLHFGLRSASAGSDSCACHWHLLLPKNIRDPRLGGTHKDHRAQGPLSSLPCSSTAVCVLQVFFSTGWTRLGRNRSRMKPGTCRRAAAGASMCQGCRWLVGWPWGAALKEASKWGRKGGKKRQLLLGDKSTNLEMGRDC